MGTNSTSLFTMPISYSAIETAGSIGRTVQTTPASLFSASSETAGSMGFSSSAPSTSSSSSVSCF